MHALARRAASRRLPTRRALSTTRARPAPHPVGALEDRESAAATAQATASVPAYASSSHLASSSASSSSGAGAGSSQQAEDLELSSAELSKPGQGVSTGKFDFQTGPPSPSTPGTSSSSLPVPFTLPPTSTIPVHRTPSQKPPFDTHAFIRALSEKGGFAEGQSKGIMGIAEELLRGRRRWAEERTISRGDLENQAYLFRAALSELRSEAASRSRADSASIRTTLVALRREVDTLAQKLKEDMDTLKHEIQMEMNTRKNESRLETKVAEVAMEEVNHKSTITIGELRTEIEAAKWNNTRRGVGVIAFFVVFIIASVELIPRPKPALPAASPSAEAVAAAQQAAAQVMPDLREWEDKHGS